MVGEFFTPEQEAKLESAITLFRKEVFPYWSDPKLARLSEQDLDDLVTAHQKLHEPEVDWVWSPSMNPHGGFTYGLCAHRRNITINSGLLSTYWQGGNFIEEVLKHEQGHAYFNTSMDPREEELWVRNVRQHTDTTQRVEAPRRYEVTSTLPLRFSGSSMATYGFSNTYQ